MKHVGVSILVAVFLTLLGRWFVLDLRTDSRLSDNSETHQSHIYQADTFTIQLAKTLTPTAYTPRSGPTKHGRQPCQATGSFDPLPTLKLTPSIETMRRVGACGNRSVVSKRVWERSVLPYPRQLPRAIFRFGGPRHGK